MNSHGLFNRSVLRLALLTLMLAALVAGCAATAQSPDGADGVRNKLTRLQSDPVLASKAPSALEEAEQAVRLAEQPLSDSEADQALGAHRVYVADRRIEIAISRATTRETEEQREQLSDQRTQVRLDARTAETERSQAAANRMASENATARALSDAEATELQRQIDKLKAESTERGLVLTLGDLLFETGSAELQAGNTSNLGRLVTFLEQYPERNAVIEGHTDNVGSVDANQKLSERRAESVRSFLVDKGISSQRLTTKGLGQEQPLASNDSADGRRSNRRVEIIIDNPPAASAVE